MKTWVKLLVLGLLALAGGYQYEFANSGNTPRDQPDALQQAYRQQLSEVWVYDARADVQRLLADDNKGSRHQRFLVSTAAIPSLLVAHNIDLAPRLPLQPGDSVIISGRYEWNEKGGVIHWTHRDPSGKLPGGNIQYQGKTYR